MVKSILTYLLLAAAMLAVLKVMVVLVEPHLTFFPWKGVTRTPADLGLFYQPLKWVTSDGETLTAWHLPEPEAEAQILFFHGNGGNLSLWLPFLSDLRERGYDVLALDYRGYGTSTGHPSEAGLLEDARTAAGHFWEEIRRPGSILLYWGRSLGGVAAAEAARHRPPDGLILESSFPDKKTLLRHYLLYRLLEPLSRYRLSTLGALSGASYPILVIHGDDDEVVPHAVGRELYERIEGPKSFLPVAGAGHNDIDQVGGESYWNRISSFVSELRQGSGPL